MKISRRLFQPTITSLATAFDDQSKEAGELVIPEDLSALSAEDIQTLYDQSIESFDALSEQFADTMSEEEVETLANITAGIEALAAELNAREEAKAERASQVKEFADRVAELRKPANAGADENAEALDEADEEAKAEDQAEEDQQADDVEAAEVSAEADVEVDADVDAEVKEPQAVAASAARKDRRIPLAKLNRNRPNPKTAPKAAPTATMRDVAFSSGEGTGFAAGTGMDWLDVAKAVDRKLQSYNATQYEQAHRSGRHIREQHSIVNFSRKFDERQMISSNDPEHVNAALDFATNEKNLPGGALVAAGGWCAPSETLYDLIELESRDGMLSLPEVGVARGGINFTTGPSFADIYSQITGFSFTEEEDKDGLYQPGAEGNVEGPKPCYTVECPEFTDHRLEVAGLCINAGLLMQRGYPEIIARTLRGAVIAHEHRMNSLMIQRMVSGSTSITLNSGQVGAAAPVLTAIELQAEHYKYTHRLARTTTLEAVFPFWVRGAIRSDLSRRMGVDFLGVTDAQIDGWFRQRGINPQFVYNWQNIDATNTSLFGTWPSTVQFLLYAAGTWVRGSNDVLTLDTVYDSTLLGNNDYTALFTEEGWLVAKRGVDSRLVTTSISATGATHIGLEIEHNGTESGD